MSGTAQNRLDQQKFTNVVMANLFLLILPFWVFVWLFHDGLFRQPPSLFGLPIELGIAPIGIVAFGPLALGVIAMGGGGCHFI